MQIRRIGWRVKGFYRLSDYALRWDMVTEAAKRRHQILEFWKRHGTAATMEAFEVSRRTLYHWKARLRKAGGTVEALNPESRAPIKRRQRQWPVAVVWEIRRLRTTHPNLGKEKLHRFLKPFCQSRKIPCPSVRSVGRIVADAPDKMRHCPARIDSRGRPKPLGIKKPRKPAGFTSIHPGQCVALDSVHRVRDNIRRYLITCTDIQSRFAFAVGVSHLSSRNAKRVMNLMETVFPHPIRVVLTDNGSEFLKEFQAHLDHKGIGHWFTYPRKPNLNAHAERFNRTLQEEFVDFHEDLLYADLPGFNDKLMDWLIWYNTDRPHWGIQLKAPMQLVAQYSPKCNMYWPNTPGGE